MLKNKNKIIILDMIPYTSGNLHIGHFRNYLLGDIYTRLMKILQYKVIRPIGWDTFGLPGEKAAFEANTTPINWTNDSIKKMTKQINKWNFIYTKNYKLATNEDNFIVSTQKIFIDLFNNNIIYKQYKWVNWDPVDCTVLADEQVINGLAWRSGAKVYKKLLNQWFLKSSIFAYDLLKQLQECNQWPKPVILAQKNWIKEINTTQINILIISNNKKYYTKGIINTSNKSQLICILDINNILSIQFFNDNDITLIDYNNFCNKKLLWITNMLCYIDTFNIPVIIANINDSYIHIKTIKDFQNDGYILTNDFIESLKYIKINQKLIENTIIYNLNDWCISRQRVWGTPIPIAYCNNCKKYITIIDKQLNNIRLKYDTYENLSNNKHYVECQFCNNNALLETDTLDTFFDSSWYYMYFFSKNNIQNTLDINNINKHMPIDLYIGGMEHANMHLIYAKIIILALKKIGYKFNFNIPFTKLINQGLITYFSYKENNKYVDEIYATKNNIPKFSIEKMSKSKLNTINPQDLILKFGTDTLRLYCISDYPINYSFLFDILKVEKIYNKLIQIEKNISNIIYDQDMRTYKEYTINITDITTNIINKTKTYYNEFKLNNVVAQMYSLYNIISNHNKNNNNINTINDISLFCVLYYPILPLLCSKIWNLIYGVSLKISMKNIYVQKTIISLLQ